jgi:hypothetical protein
MRTFVVCNELLEWLSDNAFLVKFSQTRAQYGKHGSKHDGKHGRSSWALNKSLQRDGDESSRCSALVNVCTVMQDALFVKLSSREKFSPRNCHTKGAVHVIRTKCEAICGLFLALSLRCNTAKGNAPHFSNSSHVSAGRWRPYKKSLDMLNFSIKQFFRFLHLTS